MPSVKNAITDLSGLKTLALDKAARAESSRTDQQIQRSQIKAAESRIGQAESTVTRYELEKSKAEDKLSPPPTKTVAGDGKKGGSKTVVDETEKDKLQAQVRAAELQIQQAQAAVGAAQTEAEDQQNNILISAGLTEQQGSDMSNLESQISELESLANDDQTDLTGEDYQNKLVKAKADTERLADTLPDTANAALAEFWEDIGTSWGNIHEKINEQITPTPANVDSSNNYAGFFADTEQGFDAIIANLEANGEGPEILNSVKASRNLVLGKSDNYLGGMTDGDNASLSALLTHINTSIDKMQTEELTAEDIANLNILSEETNSILESGGRAFEDVIAIPFNTAAVNLDGFAQDLAANDDFANMYLRFEGLFNGGNTYGQLQGITKDEVDTVNEFVDLTDTINEIYRDGGTPSAEQIEQLTTQGNALADNLESRYGFNSADDGGGLGSSGSRGSSGGSRRYNGLR
jgi:hypothetical protein